MEALLQAGLGTTMERVATRRPFLSFPLERHFEQCIHVRNRLANHCADCSVRLREVSPSELAERLSVMTPWRHDVAVIR